MLETNEDARYPAKDTHQPSLQRMIEDARTGTFAVIMVYKLDHLSHSVTDFHQLTNDLDTYRVSIMSVTQHVNTFAPNGRLRRSILVDFAGFERELIVERVLRSIA